MKPSILIIDDDPAQLALYSSWFEMEFPDIQWRVARQPPPEIERTQFDGALIDYQLGAVSGAVVAREWLASHPDAHLILMSGHSLRQLEEMGESLPNVRFLQKTDIQDLAMEIQTVLRDWGLLTAG